MCARLEEGLSSFSAFFVFRLLRNASLFDRRQLRQLTAACRGYHERDTWKERELASALKKKKKELDVCQLSRRHFLPAPYVLPFLSKLVHGRKVMRT